MRAISFIIVLAALLLAAPAAAQVTVCGTYREIVERLADKYNETSAFRGMSQSGSIVEIFVSPVGTWTIVAVRPSGMACLQAAGDNWHTVTPPPLKGDRT